MELFLIVLVNVKPQYLFVINHSEHVCRILIMKCFSVHVFQWRPTVNAHNTLGTLKVIHKQQHIAV